MIQAILQAAAYFAVLYWIYFAVIRILGRTHRFFTLGLAAWFASAVALALFWDGLPGPKLVLLFVYTGLWALALNFMAAIANSITLFMLGELIEKSTTEIPIAEIKKTYDQREAIGGRLQAIARTGLIEATEPDRYRITSKGRILSAPFHCMKLIFGIRKVG